MIDDESLVKTRTNTCLSYASAIPSYSVSWVPYVHSSVLESHLSLWNIKKIQFFVVKIAVGNCIATVSKTHLMCG